MLGAWTKTAYLNSFQHRRLPYTGISRVYDTDRFRPALLSSSYCFPENAFSPTTCIAENAKEDERSVKGCG